MSTDTHTLWSWDAINDQWLAILEGSEADMIKGRDRRYVAARKQELVGAAYVVMPRGAVPAVRPEAFGAEVVSGPASETAAPEALPHAVRVAVVAELRRLADELVREEDAHEMWRAISRRADELDAQ